jgi:hypothetical protein
MQSPSAASAQNFRGVQCLEKSLGHKRPKPHHFYDESKTSALGSGEPQRRNHCLSFWSVKAELGLRGPGREGPVFSKIWYYFNVCRKACTSSNS